MTAPVLDGIPGLTLFLAEGERIHQCDGDGSRTARVRRFARGHRALIWEGQRYVKTQAGTRHCLACARAFWDVLVPAPAQAEVR